MSDPINNTPSDVTHRTDSVWPPSPDGMPGQASAFPEYGPGDMRAFDLQNCWLLFLLQIVTLGIYVPFWMIRNAKVINRIAPDYSVSIPMMWTLLGLLAANFAGGFVVGILQTLNPTAGQNADTISKFFSLGVGIYQLILVFQIKGALNHILWRTSPRSKRFSGLGAFFFGPLALQIQMNQFSRAISKEALGVRPA